MENQEFVKPDADLADCDGNVFMLAGRCSKVLKRAGYADKAKELWDRVMAAQSYDAALQVMAEYVNP